MAIPTWEIYTLIGAGAFLLIVLIFYLWMRRKKKRNQVPLELVELFNEAERRLQELKKDGKTANGEKILWDLRNFRPGQTNNFGRYNQYPEQERTFGTNDSVGRQENVPGMVNQSGASFEERENESSGKSETRSDTRGISQIKKRNKSNRFNAV